MLRFFPLALLAGILAFSSGYFILGPMAGPSFIQYAQERSEGSYDKCDNTGARNTKQAMHDCACERTESCDQVMQPGTKCKKSCQPDACGCAMPETCS